MTATAAKYSDWWEVQAPECQFFSVLIF